MSTLLHMSMTVMYRVISIPPSLLFTASFLLARREKIDELRKLVYAVNEFGNRNKGTKSGNCPAGFVVDPGVEPLHAGIQVQKQEGCLFFNSALITVDIHLSTNPSALHHLWTACQLVKLTLPSATQRLVPQIVQILVPISLQDTSSSSSAPASMLNREIGIKMGAMLATFLEAPIVSDRNAYSSMQAGRGRKWGVDGWWGTTIILVRKIYMS
ncbi:hypothetical protein M405DRAFT_845209 [Rhizopogon salebrosus TDB-379]|nr:hypothetical protein M405DRAFT_845209 [Rhizopogon salebrosus TDB-379]